MHTQVTFGARGTGKTNGLADFIAQVRHRTTRRALNAALSRVCVCWALVLTRVHGMDVGVGVCVGVTRKRWIATPVTGGLLTAPRLRSKVPRQAHAHTRPRTLAHTHTHTRRRHRSHIVLCYTTSEVDESHIPEYRIMHQARAEVTWENHRYPFAGAANPKVRLGVVDVSVEATADSFAPQWLDLGDEAVRDRMRAWPCVLPQLGSKWRWPHARDMVVGSRWRGDPCVVNV